MRSVSDIKKERNRPAVVWLVIAGFFAAFAAVYEYFSFGVYSQDMIFAFLYPLLLGAVPCMIFRRSLGRLYNDGILLLTLGSVLAGVFEIYGTASPYTFWFRAAGIAFVAAGVILEALRVYSWRKRRKQRREQVLQGSCRQF